MDPRTEQFLIMIGHLGRGALLGKLPVEVVTRDGRIHRGVPEPQAPEAGGTEVNDTGLAREFAIGDEIVALDDIVELRIQSPPNDSSYDRDVV